MEPPARPLVAVVVHRARRRPIATFMFSTGIENSVPTIDNGRTRIDEMESCGHLTLGIVHSAMSTSKPCACSIRARAVWRLQLKRRGIATAFPSPLPRSTTAVPARSNCAGWPATEGHRCPRLITQSSVSLRDMHKIRWQMRRAEAFRCYCINRTACKRHASTH